MHDNQLKTNKAGLFEVSFSWEGGQIGSSRGANLIAKCELGFVLTQENASSQRFHSKANRDSIGSTKKIGTRDF